MDSPSCLWCRVSGDHGVEADYHKLMEQLNHHYQRPAHTHTPAPLCSGQVCVAFWSKPAWWCRAVVESVLVDSFCERALCFLVDHGEQAVVRSDQIFMAEQNFLELPFWVRRFHLAQIQPLTLQVSSREDSVELRPAPNWDSSACLFLHRLKSASTKTEAVILEGSTESSSMMLYLTVDNIKICVNEELVAQKFARYEEDAGEQQCLPVVSGSATSLGFCMRPRQQHSDSGNPSEGRAAGAAAELMGVCAEQSPQGLLRTSEGERTAQWYEGSGDGYGWITSSAREEDGDCIPKYEDHQEEKTGSSHSSLCSRGQEEEALACSQLLEWLNPEPEAGGSEARDEVVGCVSGLSEVLVHSTIPVEPCRSLDRAPISKHLHWVLRARQARLSPAEAFGWPAVARGSNTVIISPSAQQPLCYLPPLLTHLQLTSALATLTCSKGPRAVLLCPGWEKVQVVESTLEELHTAHSPCHASILLGVSRDEVARVKIPPNCQVLVTTPFSLVRLLETHCFLFLRVSHLVLDGAELLLARAPLQMATILQHFHKVACGPQQLVAVATQWSSHMEDLLTNHMPAACVVVTQAEEAALFCGVQQSLLMVPESSKMSVLLDSLDFSPDVDQKTLVVTSSAEETEDVFKALSSRAAFCLQAPRAASDQPDEVLQQWRRSSSGGAPVFLVTPDSCLRVLGIRDATCLVHYSPPGSLQLLGTRLLCLQENLRNRANLRLVRRCHSLLLVSEKTASQVVALQSYLERSGTLVPKDLQAFWQELQLAREDQLKERPLCSLLKSFGVCRDRDECPDRHSFNPQLDNSLLPSTGVIQVLPLHVKTASVFYGRIVQESDSFSAMVAEMVLHYAEQKPGVKEVEVGGLYAVQEDSLFHRVKVLSVSVPGDLPFTKVLARFLDVGKEEELKSHQLLLLPPRFQALPPQAVEIIVCRVKPADGEISWHPKVTRTISQKVRGLQHRAKVVFSLSKTVFVDTMVRVSQVSGTKTFINEWNVQMEILRSGLGLHNPKHIQLLTALCQEEAECGAGSGVGSASLKVLRSLPSSDGMTISPSPLEGPSPMEGPSPLEGPSSLAVSSSLAGPSSPDHRKAPSCSSLHPLMVWHQTSEHLLLRVKLEGATRQSCNLTADTAVYSCWIGSRCYRMDLELHGSIIPEMSSLDSRGRQPVLRLFKQQQGRWDRLLRTKNIFVSYDTEHLEEDEDTHVEDERRRDACPQKVFMEDMASDGLQDSSSASESD